MDGEQGHSHPREERERPRLLSGPPAPSASPGLQRAAWAVLALTASASLAHGQITSGQFLAPPLLFKLQHDQERIMIHFSHSAFIHSPPSAAFLRLAFYPVSRRK